MSAKYSAIWEQFLRYLTLEAVVVLVGRWGIGENDLICRLIGIERCLDFSFSIGRGKP